MPTGRRHFAACKRADMALGAFSCLIVVITLAAGCPGPGNGPTAATINAPLPAVPVVVATATQEDFPVTVSTFGAVEAYQTVAVKSQVSGILSEVHFKQGQFVKIGDLLIVIDPRPFQAALGVAQANLQKSAAQQSLTNIELAREEDLLKTHVASQDEYDTAKANADAAAATVVANNAAVEEARLSLSFCYINSPIDGQVGALLVNMGNAIKANDVPIMTINQVKPIYVDLSLPERRLPAIRKYMGLGPVEADATIPGEPGIEQGKIAFVDNSVASATGTIALKAEFANSEVRLWPGQYVDVTVKLTTIPNAVVVPDPAVQVGQSGTYVFVVKPDMTAESVPVVAGESYNGFTVIESGVSAGETIVVDGQLRIVPGAKVEYSRAAASPAAVESTAPRVESTLQ